MTLDEVLELPDDTLVTRSNRIFKVKKIRQFIENPNLFIELIKTVHTEEENWVEVKVNEL